MNIRGEHELGLMENAARAIGLEPKRGTMQGTECVVVGKELWDPLDPHTWGHWALLGRLHYEITKPETPLFDSQGSALERMTLMVSSRSDPSIIATLIIDYAINPDDPSIGFRQRFCSALVQVASQLYLNTLNINETRKQWKGGSI